MAAQNDDPNIPASESPSILHSPSQSESLSSKFLRKSKFLMKSNINVENSVNCSPSTNDLLPNPESSESSTTAESDIKSITHPPTGVVLHTEEETLRAEKDLQNNNDAALSTPLSSPVDHSPPSPLMEIIPPPISHRLQVTTPPESATAVGLSNTNSTSTQELQSLSELQHTPLTESQVDDAKSLVLDLLGWGVDPEYLVTSGVHPGLLYRIFTDLNLRLPTNLVLFDEG